MKKVKRLAQSRVGAPLNPRWQRRAMLGSGGAVVVEDPPALTSQRATYWANDLVLSNGDPVATWEDRVNAFDVSAAGDLRPTYRTNQINGQPAVDFDGTDDYLEGSNGISTAVVGVVVAVVMVDSLPGEMCPWATGDVASNNRYLRGVIEAAGTILVQQANNDAAGGVRGDTVISTATPYLLEWSTNTSAAWRLRVNGAVQSLTVTTGTNNGDWFGNVDNRDNFTVGALRVNVVSRLLDGKIAYLAVADAELSTDDRTALQAWVTDTYGITMA